MHTHTCYSEDATTTLKEVIHYAKKSRLDGVAVTDHNTVAGALKLVGNSELVIIPGVEVDTLNGQILALNVKTHITPKLRLTETVEEIHNVGGIVVAAHPTSVLKTNLGFNITAKSNLDAVEVINSTSFPFFLATRLSRRLAERLRLPQTAGSDAHHAAEIGTAFTLVEADSNPEDIVEAIRKGAIIPCGKPITWAKRIQRASFDLKREIIGNYSPKFSI